MVQPILGIDNMSDEESEKRGPEVRKIITPEEKPEIIIQEQHIVTQGITGWLIRKYGRDIMRHLGIMTIIIIGTYIIYINGLIWFFIQSALIFAAPSWIIIGFFIVIIGDIFLKFPEPYIEDENGNLIKNPDKTLRADIIPTEEAIKYEKFEHFNKWNAFSGGRVFPVLEIDHRRKRIRGTSRAEEDPVEWETTNYQYAKLKRNHKLMFEEFSNVADLVDIDTQVGAYREWIRQDMILKGKSKTLIDEALKEFDQISESYPAKAHLQDKIQELREERLKNEEFGLVENE